VGKKKKLQRFAENETFKNMFQPTYDEVKDGYFMKGKWVKDFFKNNNPIILELGCGKGEYTVGLAEKYPLKNFIGIDLKGARMWRGCKTSNENNMENVAFIRSKINHIDKIFDNNEIEEIWITFPDPQPKNHREKKRLTSPQFLEKYKEILNQNGIIHLKTDNSFLFHYTLEIIQEYKHKLIFQTPDLYKSGITEDVILFKTFYEKMFLEKEIKIKYLKFSLSD